MRLPAAALLVLALAGCVAQPPDGPAAEGESSVLPWGLTACRYLVGWAPVEEARLRPFLPEGFEPDPFGPIGSRTLEGTPAARALFGLEAFACASGVGLNGTPVEGMAYGSYWTSVTPPEALRVDGVDLYTVRWDTLIPDADRRAFLAAAGLPARNGTVAFGDAPVGASATYEMEGIGASTLRLDAPRTQAAPSGGVLMEFTPTDRGLAVWRSDFAWDGGSFTSGFGRVTAPAGSWAAEVLGGTEAPGQLHAGTWTFSNATLTLPRGS